MSSAEILCTGDELLRGDLAATNAAWLAGRLKELDLPLQRVVSAGDALAPLVEAVSEASAHALAPRLDDCVPAA